MYRALFTEEEVRLARERRLKYLGTAKVKLNQIQFDPPLPRDLDPKNVSRLREIFRKNRCRRLDVDNHVPAVVSRHNLDVALRKANISALSQLTNNRDQLPLLDFPTGELQALHGRHRIQAGAELLPPADRWWSVDIYLDDIGEDLKTALVEEYANQKKPTDGEIYRKIRQYEDEGNEAFRERWFVRLSANNQDRIKQLGKEANRRLRRGFDRLLLIPGLWQHGMRISMIHRLIATNCIEEILTYLDYIWKFWSSLVASDADAMKKIDSDTVDSLQLLAPGKTRSDAQTAAGLVLGGRAFAAVEEEERRAIWDRLKDTKRPVPSLYTFFEDFKYLESCAHCVKRLFGPSTDSIWKTMSFMFDPSDHSDSQSLIQTSESTFRSEHATDAVRLNKAYLQVWLYAMRHYPLMPQEPKQEDGLLAKQERFRDERVIYEMAEFAHRLGFRSLEIDAIMDSCPDHQIARAALLQARKSYRFRYPPHDFDALVNRIVECFATAIPADPVLVHELLADSIVGRQARCGMPTFGAHKQDRHHLFLDRLCSDDLDATDTITTFFVRRCVFEAFFGNLTDAEPDVREQNQDLPADDPPGSPLFVGDEDLPNQREFTSQFVPPAEQEPQPQPQDISEPQIQQGLDQRPLPDQRTTGIRREKSNLRPRRKRKITIRKRQKRAQDIKSQEPMELDWLSSESSHSGMNDQECADSDSHEVCRAMISQTESGAVSLGLSAAPSRSVTFEQTELIDDSEFQFPERCSGSVYTVDEDGQNSTLSPEFAALEQEITDILTPREQLEAIASRNHLQFGGPTHTHSTRSESDTASEAGIHEQRVSDTYIENVIRAQEEQERVEEDLERERFEEEFGHPYQDHSGPNPTLLDEPYGSTQNANATQLSESKHNMKPKAPQAADPETAETSAAIYLSDGESRSLVENSDSLCPGATNVTSSAQSSVEADAAPNATDQKEPPSLVEISFWVFEREHWRKTDYIKVNPSNTAPVERMAKKYARKKFCLYDRYLQNLSPAQCYRGATADGNNAIFLIPEHEEQQLVAEGRISKERQLLSLISQALDQVETETRPPAKRHRYMMRKRT
ncbi:hypothetical protein BO82DRAFT_426169 [Aspergillus uvarum CBS 121591]|uniref:Uncharacterized protein n=1 Tax=Aspergillus uvarum CBS 121591 TaxID=1448315 RepID=A0A319CLU3_9EURO|nr:hypothetical protein BO82DRAFT_426169 [Aspergillus uvarum CBS 121591]PYH76418.1 hypothetical protein BO82DRAFT_426169 [Aspergillus uvarum CBS 121591]